MSYVKIYILQILVIRNINSLLGSGFKVSSKSSQRDSSSDLEAMGRYNIRNTPGSKIYTQGYFKKHFDKAGDTNSDKGKKFDIFSAGILYIF